MMRTRSPAPVDDRPSRLVVVPGLFEVVQIHLEVGVGVDDDRGAVAVFDGPEDQPAAG